MATGLQGRAAWVALGLALAAPPVAAQTVLNGGNALGGQGGGKRIVVSEIDRTASAEAAVAEEEAGGGAGIGAAASRFFGGLFGGGSGEPEASAAGEAAGFDTLARALVEAGGPSGLPPETQDRLRAILNDPRQTSALVQEVAKLDANAAMALAMAEAMRSQQAGAGLPEDAGPVETLRAIGEMQEEAVARLAGFGAAMAAEEAEAGRKARAERLAEEAAKAARPPTPAEVLFSQFGRTPGPRTPYEESRAAALR